MTGSPDGTPERKPKGPPRGVRPQLGDVLSDVFTSEWLKELAEEIKSRTKNAWGFCPHCKKKVQCEVKDLDGIVRGALALVQEVEGRPGTASTESQGVTLVVQRVWPAKDAA